MARQPPGGWLPCIDSEISPRRNRAYSPTARFMECVAFRTHPFQAQVSSVELPCRVIMIGSCSLPTETSRAALSQSESRLGTALGIVIFLILYTGFTVHFWGSTWILVGLLVGVRARLGELGQLDRAAGQVDAALSS